jgi:hypothetical protein
MKGSYGRLAQQAAVSAGLITGKEIDTHLY